MTTTALIGHAGVTPVYREPNLRAEQVTQFVLGETARARAITRSYGVISPAITVPRRPSGRSTRGWASPTRARMGSRTMTPSSVRTTAPSLQPPALSRQPRATSWSVSRA